MEIKVNFRANALNPLVSPPARSPLPPSPLETKSSDVLPGSLLGKSMTNSTPEPTALLAVTRGPRRPKLCQSSESNCSCDKVITRLGGIWSGLATGIGFAGPPPQPTTQSKNADTNTNRTSFFIVKSPFYQFAQDIRRPLIHPDLQQANYTESERPGQEPCHNSSQTDRESPIEALQQAC